MLFSHLAPLHRSLAVVIALLTIVGTLSACAASPRDDWRSTHEMLWSVQSDLLSEPVIAGDVVLAYVAAGSGTETIVAWDIEDGTRLWQRDTLPGRSPRGVAHRVAVIESDGDWQVSVLVPQRHRAAVSEWSRVEILDARTGDALAPELTDQGVWADRPSVCGAEWDRFCIEGLIEPETDNANDRVYEYSAEAPAFIRTTGDTTGYFEGGLSLTDRVSVSDEDELRYGEDGTLLWTRAYEDVFGPGSGTAGGWAWHDRRDDDAPLLGMGFTDDFTERDLSRPQEISRSLAQGRTVRLDRQTGDTIWTVEAETCHFAADFGIWLSDRILPLCRYNDGSITLSWNGAKVDEYHYADVDVDLLGIDAESGDIVWELPLGRAGTHDADPESADAFASHGAQILARADDGTLLIVDTATGADKPVAEEQVVLCATDPTTVELDAIWENPTYALANSFALCGPDGTVRDDALPQTATLELAGYDTTGPAAVHTSDGLALFAARPTE